MSVRSICSTFALLLVCLLRPTPAGSFVLTTQEVNGRPQPRRWPASALRVPFVLNDQPFELLPHLSRTSQPLLATELALGAWSVAPLKLTLAGTTDTTDVGLDGENLITFVDTPRNRDLVGSDVVRTYTWTRSGAEVGRILEADIVFSPKYPYSTDGTANAYDLQATLAHMLGHVVGLNLSPIPAATMYAFAYTGQTAGRTLHSDDLAGLRTLYGGIDAEPGTLVGQVVTLEGAPVFGAHVSATDNDGIVPVGVLTDRSGRFTLPVRAGQYRISVEPLDGPMTPDHLGSALRGARRDFRTAFAPGYAPPSAGSGSPAVFQAAAGETTAIGMVRVLAQTPLINPQEFAWSRNGEPWRGGVAQLRPGDRALLGVSGPGLSWVPREGFSISGANISLDRSQIQLLNPVGGQQSARLALSVAPDAPPGARSLYLTGGNELAVFTGLIEVIRP